VAKITRFNKATRHYAQNTPIGYLIQYIKIVRDFISFQITRRWRFKQVWACFTWLSAVRSSSRSRARVFGRQMRIAAKDLQRNPGFYELSPRAPSDATWGRLCETAKWRNVQNRVIFDSDSLNFSRLFDSHTPWTIQLRPRPDNKENTEPKPRSQ